MLAQKHRNCTAPGMVAVVLSVAEYRGRAHAHSYQSFYFDSSNRDFNGASYPSTTTTYKTAKELYVKRHDKSVCSVTLQHMQGNRGKVGQITLVSACTKISRNKSRRQGNHTVESTSANRQNHPQQQTRHHNPCCDFGRQKCDKERS